MKTQNTLQARRKELGLTYTEISERTGIPRSTIYDYFSKGDVRLEKVLDELGMEIKNCSKPDVSNKREQLIAYGEELEGRNLYLEGTTLDKFTDEYLSNL